MQDPRLARLQGAVVPKVRVVPDAQGSLVDFVRGPEGDPAGVYTSDRLSQARVKALAVNVRSGDAQFLSWIVERCQHAERRGRQTRSPS